jgi:hypothetical protein
MSFLDQDVPALTVLLSPERLGALTRLTGSARAAIELHQETLGLGTSLMTVIATVEIALRNSVCENLSQHFANTSWLMRPPAPFQWRDQERDKVKQALDSARRAAYSKLTQAEKSALDAQAYPRGRPPNLPHLKRAKDRRSHINVTEGKVIAELTLYFWKRLFGPDYEHSLWRPSLKRMFPNKKIKRADLADHLEEIYQSRNRLAHHEPVLHTRFSSTMIGIQFLIENLGTKAPSSDTPLARLVANEIAEVNAKAKALHDRLDQFRVKPGI